MTTKCKHCGATYRNVDRNEDGEPEIDAQRCASPDCEVYLCANCEQFECDGCGLAHCTEHMVRYNELRLCGVCITDFARCDDEEAA